MSTELRNRLTLTQYCEAYATTRDLTAGAIYQYKQAARSFEWWAEESVYVDQLNTDMVNQWVAFLCSTGMGRATVRNRRTHLLAMWRQAHNSGLTVTFPVDIRPVKVRHRAPEAWTHAQVAKLLIAAANMEGIYRRIQREKAAAWDLMIRVAWDTGLRQGDVFKLRRDHINDIGLVVVTQSKTGRVHVARLHPSTLNRINALGILGDVCPWPMTHEFFRQEFQQLTKAAGLVGSFKKLRKSSASNVEADHPGAGASHLGHVPGSKIAAMSYLDPRIVVDKKPMPKELPASKKKENKTNEQNTKGGAT